MNFTPAEREALLPKRRFPSGPPAEAMAAVDQAWEIARRMAFAGRELHFGDGAVQMRTLSGTVLRELSAEEAVDIMCGFADAA